MKPSPLPFQVLGQVAPLLAWVEGDDGSRLPPSWTSESVPFSQRERSWLLRELPTYSYDNVHEIVDGSRASHRGPRKEAFSWSWERRRPRLSVPVGYDLRDAFHELNRYFFIWNGTEPCVREGRMEELHELAIRLPAGHVVRHGHARAVAEGVLGFDEALELPELVTLLPSNSFGLRSVVRQGLAESHLHLTAVTSAEETWADNLLRPLSVASISSRTSAERRLLVLNLLAGKLLALAIWQSFRSTKKPAKLEPERLLELLDRVYFAPAGHEERQAARAFEAAIQLRALWDADVPNELLFLQRWLAPAAAPLELLALGSSLPGSSPETLRERYRFVHQLHLAAHLRLVQLTPRRTSRESTRAGSDPRRRFLHEALFRYLVCRTHHWQQVAQQGRTTGLRHFRGYYGSELRQLQGLSDLQYAELVFERLRQWRGLRVLEGRVAPPKQAHDLVPWLLAFARPEDRRIKKFGIVVHFKKEDEHKEERGLSARSWPVPKLRWGRRRRLVREEGLRLYRLLRTPTPVTPFIVGIDACNLELSTPPEVFAPVFRFLRDLPIQLSGCQRSYTPFFRIDPVIRHLVDSRRLGMTYHVGEDFRHLLSGLRAIYEVVDFLAPQPGDRLGHGTALALQPSDWLEHNGYQAVLPKLEWLDTLVWLHHFLGPGDDLVGELAIEDKIQRCSWEVYGKAMGARYDPLGLDLVDDRARRQNRRRGLLDWNWSPLTLWDAWRLRQLDPYSIDLAKLLRGELELRPVRGFGEERRRWRSIQERVLRAVKAEIGSRNAYLLLALYWLSPEARMHGGEVIVVDMQQRRDLWLELCRRVEEKMKRLIHEKELVVEVNPSSNRIIGPMERYAQHHVFHLTLDKNDRLSREVRVSINTDNPAVCNTTLAHEYYLLGEILIGRGVPEAEVVRWLEWLRTNGAEYNFVRRLKTPEEEPEMRRLFEWLRGIRPTVREERTRERKLKAFWSWQRGTRLRAHGFDLEAVAAEPEMLERLAGLDEAVRKMRHAGGSGVSDRLAARLEQLERELAQLREQTVPPHDAEPLG